MSVLAIRIGRQSIHGKDMDAPVYDHGGCHPYITTIDRCHAIVRLSPEPSTIHGATGGKPVAEGGRNVSVGSVHAVGTTAAPGQGRWLRKRDDAGKPIPILENDWKFTLFNGVAHNLFGCFRGTKIQTVR